MANIFGTKKSQSENERNSLSDITGEKISSQSDSAIFESWINDSIGAGIKNTQQLDVNWENWENHVFFHSAEAKTNIAIDKIINQYPFDGTVEEKINFYSKIDGFTKWLIDGFDHHTGYGNFTGNHRVYVKDLTGWLAPELSRTEIGQSKITKDISESGATIEFWIKKYENPSLSQEVILQKRDGNVGISVWAECQDSTNYSINLILASDNFKSIKASIDNLNIDEWYHVAFVYFRANTERIKTYINGEYSGMATNTQAELDDITIGSSPLYLGIGGTMQSEAGSLSNPDWLLAGIDELRLWSKIRTSQEIYRDYLQNISAQVGLKLYFRFNEPNSVDSWQTPEILLDYSGNSFHSIVSGDIEVFRENNDTSPIQNLEEKKDNLILFPDWPATKTKNEDLVKSANHYDINNPNLITKLVPRHYFEEALFFEGIEKNLEDPMVLDHMRSPYVLPGHSKIPSKTIVFSFLLVWAAYFDDIKLYLDAFSSLDKIDYVSSGQIPPIMINFLTEYYGIPITNPFANETLDKFKDGKNLENEKTTSQPLNKMVDQLWRRVLINMPFLLRSRGTISGIKSLMNTLGLESNSFFNLREYGGSLSPRFSSSRVEQNTEIISIDFSRSSYAKSANLKSYRHEPGAPDPYGAPMVEDVTFQIGDISFVIPAEPGISTSYLSGSWAVEGHYQVSNSEEPESLFHILNSDNQLLVNAIANPVDKKLSFFSSSYDSNNSECLVEIEDIDIWDSYTWYICLNSIWKENLRTIRVFAGKVSKGSIVEWRSAEKSFERDSSKLPSEICSIDPSKDFNLYISDSGASIDTLNFSSDGFDSYSYSGKMHSLKFWTCSIEENIAFEHCKNPLSIENVNPIVQDPIPIKVDGVNLSDYNGRYTGKLALGSWEKLRFNIAGLETLDNLSEGQSTFSLIDTTQNNRNLEIYGTDGLQVEKIRYSIVTPSSDSSTTDNKVRIRSFLDEKIAIANSVHYGELYELPSEIGLDDKRFSIDSSIVHALNKDMVNLLGNLEIMNEYLGAPELEYAVDYPEIRKIRELYFKRLISNMPYNTVIEFQRWFSNNFDGLIEKFIPYTADFLGINFVIESHLLERHKYEYKQGDIHVDIKDRITFSQVPIITGTIRNDIT